MFCEFGYFLPENVKAKVTRKGKCSIPVKQEKKLYLKSARRQSSVAFVVKARLIPQKQLAVIILLLIDEKYIYIYIFLIFYIYFFLLIFTIDDDFLRSNAHEWWQADCYKVTLKKIKNANKPIIEIIMLKTVM